MRRAVILALLAVAACDNRAPRYSGGTCLRADDGYVWKIVRVEKMVYIATGWHGDGWGNDVRMHAEVFDDTMTPTTCPRVDVY